MAALHMMSELDLLRERLNRERQAREEAERTVEERSRELDKAKLEAEFASKTKNEFLSNMSHELRTPLNGILGFCEILLSGAAGDLTGDQAEFLREIKTSGTRLTNTFDQILFVSKLHNNSEGLSKEEVALHDVIANSLRSAESRAAEHGLKLVVDIDRRLPTILANPMAVAKIVSNLLDNALKFGAVGSEVMVLAYRNAEGGVQIDIADRGIGMTAEEIKQATLPFYQADGGRTRKYEGSGLGLTIVKGLADLLDADFRLFSVPSKVTRASVVFPVFSEDTKTAVAQ